MTSVRLQRFTAARLFVVALALVGAARFAHAQPGAADPDRRCLQCHGQDKISHLSAAERRAMVGTRLETEAPPSTPLPPMPPLTGKEPEARPGLLIKPGALLGSVHAKLKCVECHTDAAQLPHTPSLNRATCATACHDQPAKDYAGGAHEAARAKGDPKAPTCASCHGGHDVLKISDRKSDTNKLNSLHLCGDCHTKHTPTSADPNPQGRIANYLGSAHAKALVKAGLPMAATCADCHGAHGVRPASDPASKVNRAAIPETCGKCHVGIVETYAQSVHGKQNATKPGSAAICTDCHTAHQISLAETPNFMLDIVNQCGRCHDSKPGSTRKNTYYATYHESYHGQVTRLGTTRAARCSDCHGSHDIRSLDDPQSRVAPANLVGTCGQCHPGANASFVKFDPHADFHDPGNYPILHGVWLYFMVMMSGVFSFFGLHTILWFVRASRERRRLAKLNGHTHSHERPPTAIRRFTALDRVNHALVALTFFGLTATGIPLVFSEDRWARWLAGIVGGVEAAGLWHRFFAILLIINLGLHFAGLARNFFRRKCTAKEWLFGPNSLLPRWKDAKDIMGMFRWFLVGGHAPRLDRWTYWEKFDYWAEVGGSFIIGGSGLLLWFPVLASHLLPGWIFNVAMIVHGYEALLAIGFIFTIHFFNAHLRPGTFPVDEVIFTGSVPEHELKEQRPEEYDRLVAAGKLEALRVPNAPASKRPTILAIAIVSVGFGLFLLALILIGGLT